ncbi:MAG: sigma-54-dependent Fis family transcriptional regulator [Spirochaetales bacterium]|nr:sigma-54-dependent Fis family transcriptional regulator [Spirochaetales bacterium]
MKYVFIVEEKGKYSYLKSLLPCCDVIILDSLEMLSRIAIYKTDIAIIDIPNIEKSIRAQELLNMKCPVLCYYTQGKENYHPLEKFCSIRFFPRPLEIDSLKDFINIVLSEGMKKEEKREIALIGSSDVMENVRGKIEKYAKTDYAVHFSGNTGTGKNNAARRLHHLSSKNNKNMIYVNCGAFANSGLIESSFFGHSKGSYTGSSSPRSGFIKNADKSTLFLDEIENMSHQLQELLLDTIDSGRYRCVGTDKEIVSDFRIVTASNIPLEELLRTGKLRYDFYYRIAEREIRMPDLAEHEEDIPELVQDYEQRHNILRYRVRDYDVLFNRPWKGNIRELYKEISLIHELQEEGRTYTPNYSILDLETLG